MSIFSRKTKEEKVEKKVKKETSKKVAAPAIKSDGLAVRKDSLQSVIIRPHITEKATLLAEANTYVFEVNTDASKPVIAKAVKAIYNVAPAKITIARNPAKQVIVRGKIGHKSGIKKAYVVLQKGDKIEFA